MRCYAFSARRFPVRSQTDLIQLAYFFIPLPEALPLRDRFTLTIGRSLSMEALGQLTKSYPKDEAELYREYLEISASLKMWHSSTAISELDAIEQLFEIARKALPSLPDRPNSGAEHTLFSDSTIVEVMAPLDGPLAESLSTTFDRALRHVQEFQRAYYVSQRRPVTLVRREKLPAFVPYAIRTVTATSDEWPETLALLHLNMNVTSLTRGSDLAEADEREIVQAMEAQPGQRAFASFLDLWRHAHNSLELEGDYRATVIFAAVSAEVLLDDLLAHLLWEEARRPEEATSFFDAGLAKRVRTHFHARIGGAGWSGKEDGPIRSWSQDVAGLRHRVVHAGYEPTIDEARKALSSLHTLQKFVSDRIASEDVIDVYPRTAMMFVGRDQLKACGRWSARLQALESDINEPHWATTFVRWKMTMQRNRQETAQTPPKISRAAVVAVLHPEGNVVWVLHDFEVGKARIASEPQDLSPGQQQKLAELIRNCHSYPEPMSVVMDGANALPVADGDWVDEYRLIPRLGVMVNRQDFNL